VKIVAKQAEIKVNKQALASGYLERG